MGWAWNETNVFVAMYYKFEKQVTQNMSEDVFRSERGPGSITCFWQLVRYFLKRTRRSSRAQCL